MNCCIRYLFQQSGEREVQPRKRSENVSDFVHEIVEPINRQEGNALSVATLAKNGMTDGRMPLGTAAVENVELH